MPNRLLLLLPGLLAATAALAQVPTQTLKLPLTTVTVYLNATALEHRAAVPLAAGLNRLVVPNLAPRLDGATLEVQLGDGAELLGADEDDDQPAPANPPAADSLARTQAAIRTLEGELQGLQQEKAFLLANQTLPAGTQAQWSSEVQKGAALMRTRLPAIQQETNSLTARLQDLQAQATRLTTRTAAPGPADASRHVLLVRATRAATVPLVLRYYVRSRQPWVPKLAIRANATGQELEFAPHGQLINQSGLAWQQVQLVLVRQVLGENLSRPSLNPWELSFDGGDDIGEGRVDEFVVKGTAQGRAAPATQSARYLVPTPVSLAAGARRDLALPSVKLPARAEYLALPKLTEAVFLQAKVTGWEGLPLPEQAAVYHQGSYVGTTDLDTRAYNDSLEIALGHDEQLVVGRAKLEDLSSTVGDKRRVRLTYELNVRNSHPEAVRLRLLDQVPVSAEKDISVRVLDTSGATLDERTGKLTWVLAVPAGSSQKRRFTFLVEYPRTRRVEIINHAVRRSSPRFR